MFVLQMCMPACVVCVCVMCDVRVCPRPPFGSSLLEILDRGRREVAFLLLSTAIVASLNTMCFNVAQPARQAWRAWPATCRCLFSRPASRKELLNFRSRVGSCFCVSLFGPHGEPPAWPVRMDSQCSFSKPVWPTKCMVLVQWSSISRQELLNFRSRFGSCFPRL